MNTTHRRRIKRRLTIWGATLAAGAAAAGALSGTSTAATASTGDHQVRTTVLAGGLDIPKYLEFGPDGLYVAESGVGGQDCVDIVGITGAPTQACTGATGKVLRIDASGRVRTVTRGLASTVETDIGEVQGPIAVAFSHGRPLVLQRGAFVGPTGTSTIPGRLGRQFGKLLGPHGATLADFAQFAAHHPQPAATLGGVPGETTYDSDVHDVVSWRGGYAFADAGANDVLWRDPAGKLTLLARLPSTPEVAPAGSFGPGSPEQIVQAQAVPSSVAVGPDGGLYVATLGGLPGLPGTASVYRVAPGRTPEPVVTGLSRVTDLAFDQQERLLLLEAKVGGTPAPQTSPGALLRATLVPGRAVHAVPLPVPGLSAPTGLAIGPDRAVYVTNKTTTPGQGEVLRITDLG